jgi:hypothetical protein
MACKGVMRQGFATTRVLLTDGAALEQAVVEYAKGGASLTMAWNQEPVERMPALEDGSGLHEDQ